MSIKFYEVGGAVRDKLLGLSPRDIDFVAVGAKSFEDLENHLENNGFEIKQSKSEYVTIRARIPQGSSLGAGVADFVMARKDGPSSNSRHPDFVEPGSLNDDLSRRDFTINAMARDVESSQIIDPFFGHKDLNMRILRFVGVPIQRVKEDGLRVLRAIRFCVTHNMTMHPHSEVALRQKVAREALENVSRERMREELEKALKVNTPRTIQLLTHFHLHSILWKDSLRLSATMKA